MNKWQRSSLGLILLVVGAVVVLPLFQGAAGELIPEGWARRNWWIVVLGVVVFSLIAVVAVVKIDLADRTRRQELNGTVRETQLSLAASKLAADVESQWRTEARVRGLLDEKDQPLLAAVSWSLERVPNDGVLVGTGGRRWLLGQSGGVEELVDLLQDVPSRRLVIRGDRAAGKTTAAVLLTVWLLGRRGPDDPIPVLFSAAAWNPELDLATWLERRLAEDHPALRNTDVYGDAAPGRLIAQGKVLPVLDGLDEVLQKHRPRVLTAIRTSPLPLPGLILTCRTEEYEYAEGKGDWLMSAAVVALNPISPTAAIDYLTRTSWPEGRVRWEPVFDRLRTEPDGPLATALSSALMVWLAREVYKDTSAVPESLNRLATKEEIEAHLLSAFVPSVFPPVHTPGRTGGRWKGDDARRWLAALATLMNRLNTRDFAWWELTRAARPVSAILAGLLAAVLAGSAFGLGTGLLFGPVAGLAAGLATGVLMGILCGWTTPRPAAVQVHWTGRLRPAVTSGLSVGLVAGVAAGLAGGAGFGAGVGLAFGVPIAVLYGLSAPDATALSVTPRSLLSQDIKMAFAFGVAYGVPTSIVGGVLGGVALGLVFGAACGLAGGLLYGPIWVFALKVSRVGVIAWVHFILARLWLVPQGKLPWRLMDFLDDVHKLGVLRQSGGVYQFRHALLQSVLDGTASAQARDQA